MRGCATAGASFVAFRFRFPTTSNRVQLRDRLFLLPLSGVVRADDGKERSDSFEGKSA